MAQYRDIALLGEGGCSHVWTCERAADGVHVAKKVLRATAGTKLINRFQQEVRILAKLDHPNIVKVLDTQLAAAPYWFVMPLYRTTLRDDMTGVIGDGVRVSKLFSAILNGMEYAHREGVIHRDLKAANVLLNNDDDVVISDFGIGRIMDAEGDRFTATGARLGSYGYMSPEQSSDTKHVDIRSDIYSLGRMLYELHTERLNTAVQDLNRLPPAIAPIVERCTQYKPENRYQSVSELKDAWRLATAAPSAGDGVADARRLISELTATPQMPAKVEQLFMLLDQNTSDKDLLRDAIMEVPPESIAIRLKAQRDQVRKTITEFVEHVLSQTWGNTYVDKIGNRCGNLFIVLPDAKAKAELFKCVLILGVKFKRYALLEILAHLIQAASSEADQHELESSLRTVPQETRLEAGKWLELADINPQIAGLFRT
jgi:serine/threonine protein kinase